MNNDDLDDIINQEDNPYDNPDDAFDNEENAYNAGYTLAFEAEGDTIDIDREIDFPSLTDKDVIQAFKRGFEYGGIDYMEMVYGDEDYEPKYKDFQDIAFYEDDDNDDKEED